MHLVSYGARGQQESLCEHQESDHEAEAKFRAATAALAYSSSATGGPASAHLPLAQREKCKKSLTGVLCLLQTTAINYPSSLH